MDLSGASFTAEESFLRERAALYGESLADNNTGIRGNPRFRFHSGAFLGCGPCPCLRLLRENTLPATGFLRGHISWRSACQRQLCRK